MKYDVVIIGAGPAGIFTAGTAQKFVNIDGYMPGKKIVILGSGDIGLIMARRMTLEGAKVLGVAELMPYSNGLNRNIVQCLNDFNIPLYLSHSVSNIIGKDRIEKVVISKVDDKFNFIEGSEMEFEVDKSLQFNMITSFSNFCRKHMDMYLKLVHIKYIVQE